VDRESERSSSARNRWWLVGGVVAFVVGFSLLERIVPTPEPAESSRPAGEGTSWAPGPPQVIQHEDGGVEIRHDLFRRTTIRLGNEDDEQALFDCLEQGIAETFGPGSEDWDRTRVRRETQLIQDDCVRPFDVPVMPRLPESPD